MEIIPKLPAYARIGRYRAVAREMRSDALFLDRPARRAYVRIAELWESLAADIENRFRN